MFDGLNILWIRIFQGVVINILIIVGMFGNCIHAILITCTVRFKGLIGYNQVPVSEENQNLLYIVFEGYVCTNLFLTFG